MWKCSDCEREFLNTHQWHSCISLTLEERLQAASERAADLYRSVEAAVRTCGDFRIHPQKSRVAFISAMTFVGVRLARAWVDVSFIAPRPIDDERITAIACYGPTSFAHTLRLTEPSDIDDRVIEWLCIAKRRGDQDTLNPHASVEPAVGRVLSLLTVPLRCEVVDRDGLLVLELPTYAVDLFDLHRSLTARLRGVRVPATLELAGSGGWLDCGGRLEQLGLGSGDRVDVTLRSCA